MISHLQGTVDQVSIGLVVVDVAGVGFAVRVPRTTSAGLSEGQKVRLSTHLSVRQDDMTLYGFSSQPERELFRLLTTISGIGPKLALNILSSVSPPELAAAVLDEDWKTLTSIPGIGNRTARRIVVELCEKIAELAPLGKKTPADSLEREAEAVLLSLGCTDAEASSAVRQACERISEKASVERLVMEAMRVLGEAQATTPR
ncbi:MAG: Holliday junction branch migration protein RuvA [Armatimonadetes bacterium]|nr:Holliday junction branch migration protein RuvA [Armatimonadota bacterium]